jgi:hypothetical protein
MASRAYGVRPTIACASCEIGACGIGPVVIARAPPRNRGCAAAKPRVRRRETARAGVPPATIYARGGCDASAAAGGNGAT